jgi:hypothetical protein
MNHPPRGEKKMEERAGMPERVPKVVLLMPRSSMRSVETAERTVYVCVCECECVYGGERAGSASLLRLLLRFRIFYRNTHTHTHTHTV